MQYQWNIIWCIIFFCHSLSGCIHSCLLLCELFSLQCPAGHRKVLFDADNLKKAYGAVSHQNMSVCQAAKVYKLHASVLGDRFKGRFAHLAFKSALSQEEEKILYDHLEYMKSVGYEYTEKQITDMAAEFSIALDKKSVADPRFGEYWFKKFKERYIKAAKQKELMALKSKMASKDIIDSYYEDLKTVLDKHDLTEHPDNIYILDEITLPLERETENTQNNLGSASLDQSGTLTLIGCGDASGGLVPPYLVLPCQDWDDSYLDGMCSGVGGECTKSGLSNTPAMKNYIESHFKKFVRLGKKQRPTLIFYDGHKLPLTLILKTWAEQNNVIFHVIPAYASCLLGFDVGCFSGLAEAYSQECLNMRELKNINTAKDKVGKIVNHCYLKLTTPSTLMAGFSRIGIYPFTKTVIEFPPQSQAEERTVQSMNNEIFMI